jgi:SOS response regulatory protein OraA/RecX
VLKLALKRLESSDRFEADLRRALGGFPDDVVERVVTHLRERRYLDDGRLVGRRVEANVGRRAVGDDRLRDRLIEKGVDPATVEAALEGGESEENRADAILSARYTRDGSRAKAGRYLMSRGFSEETVESALNRYFGEEENPW